MQEQLDALRVEALRLIAETTDADAAEALRVRFLGRKGELTGILRGLKDIAPAERGLIGAQANQVKVEIEAALAARVDALQADRFGRLAETEWVDLTKPVPADRLGHLHPVTQTWSLIEEIFKRIGFEIADGPEIETDANNFELLNMPKHHPARDTQDTFYFADETLLRTQTSPVQIRHMLGHRPPIRIIAPGRVYRRDYDLTHTPMFHQFEGLVVAEGITIADLKGTCIYAMRALLGEETKLRFRPHHFPFTEPSFEVDASCNICGGDGCRTCKHTGWIEMAGAGMVHPQVLRNVGYDPDAIAGFAFGFGIDRIAMNRFGISDLRMMFEGDLRFLSQF
jgi:phenylalanyl-tRNA synthetase alpha chain